jgi:hypothetical protein
MMGMVKVDELTGFSQALAPQLLVESVEEDVVDAAWRGSITRFGTAMFIIASILPTTCGALTIFAARSSSMLVDLAASPTKSTSDR